eukprot:2173386-Rhodomonas_salina.2
MAHGACDTMCGSQVSCDSGYAMFGSNSAQPTEEEGRSSHDLCHSVGRPQRLMPCVSTAHGVEFAARYAVAVPHIALHSKLVGSLMSNPSTAQHSKSDKPYASTAHRVASALRATPVPHITTKQAPTNLDRTWDSEGLPRGGGAGKPSAPVRTMCYLSAAHRAAKAHTPCHLRTAPVHNHLRTAPVHEKYQRAISVPHIALQARAMHCLSTARVSDFSLPPIAPQAPYTPPRISSEVPPHVPQTTAEPPRDAPFEHAVLSYQSPPTDSTYLPISSY